MTRTVTRAAFPPGLAAWLALGVALTTSARLHAEPLVSRIRDGVRPGSPTAGWASREGLVSFEAAHGGQAPIPTHASAPSRRPTDSTREALRAAFLRANGAQKLTLFFGYFGAFLPPATPPTDGTPPPTTSVDNSLPSPPAPRVPLLQPFVPTSPGLPPQAPQVTETPEPATLLSGLIGAGLAGLAAWKRRRKNRQTA
jgi:hypothetical protein